MIFFKRNRDQSSKGKRINLAETDFSQEMVKRKTFYPQKKKHTKLAKLVKQV